MLQLSIDKCNTCCYNNIIKVKRGRYLVTEEPKARQIKETITMTNITITIDRDGTMRFNGYDTYLIKELKRSRRRDRAKYDPMTKTWTLKQSRYPDEASNDVSLIEWFEGHGATVKRVITDRDQLAREWDATYNERADGYNPYR